MSAVDQVTDNLAAASISDPSQKTATGADSAQIEAVNAIVAEGRRLYIGNLAYATDEKSLNDFFKGFLVESTSIPTNPRSNRPVGYAFVDLSTATEAQRAISELSGKEILDRKVSVQLARRPDAADKPSEGVNGAETTNGGEGRRRQTGARGRGRGRGRGGRGGRNGERSTAPGTNENGVLPLQDNTTQAASAQNAQNGAATATATATETSKPAQPREQRQRGPPEDGIPSKTKVMVANLPYDLTEEKLKELFAAYKPISAKLALRPIPRFMVKKLQARGEARKGRGFGFVSLESEELQQKAVNEMNGKDIDGREIAVKVAIDTPGKEDDAVDATGTENAAAAPPEAATATA